MQGCPLPLPFQIHCIARAIWRNYCTNIVITSKTLYPKSLKGDPKPIFRCQCDPSTVHAPALVPESADHSTKQTTLLVEAFHEKQRLKDLLERLNMKDSSPLQILQDEGDWPKEHFWAVIRFLRHASRAKEILQVFDVWNNTEKSRINEFNYEMIIGCLGEEGLMEEAVLAFKEMKSHGLHPSLQIYHSIIHGYARNCEFDDALSYLNEMKDVNLAPETDTYEGLIEAYGKCRMYDEMGMCVKKMELDGCLPERSTYNLLMRESARGGLLTRMERIYQTMRSKRMNFQPSTLIAMLEAYVDFGIVEKMERVIRRVLNSKTYLKEHLVRKMARVYIENYMFSRLEDLGLNVSSKTGRTDLFWCLRLLSHACLLSRKGMDSIILEMEEEKIPWNVTVANIILLAYLKMKDFTRLRALLAELPTLGVKPDIVTVGILFDAKMNGFNGKGIEETWRRMGLINWSVEMNTDALVLSAFGKGYFLKKCEQAYSSLEPEAREDKRWTYRYLVDMVAKHSERPSAEES
ncbi:pentatricopeptide repeat-containing protein [Tripterygium wilfordii]|uniref:Pentatricopeptide repeat-containing protein n=1 Tax=Tripterygium wilfordii TaxID=458696 RepID=A0A7J7DE37_TRIWF|nr:pentatricopeptide repeat-containing protein At4g14190, chloroplastic [Tripterygium wilfordii]KAF5744336.1 pentatricopeptide repeat-containing protein [Tripterygium wilfordii]